MANSAETLARELADLKRRIAAMERGTQLQTSTLGTSAGVVSVVHGLEAGMSAGAAAAEALQKAATAQATADGAVHTFFGDTEPGGASFGDLWRDPSGTVRQYDGEDWQEIADPQVAADVEEALDRVAHAEEALDGKITTYFNASSNPPENDNEVNLGDLWIVSDGGNLIRRWNGTAWVDAPAGSAALADRAVTSTKLETDLVLTSRVIAGEATGRRAEMDPSGFTVYGPTDDGTGTRVIARMGYSTASDYFAVSNTQGIAGASMAADGTVSGARFNAADIALDGRRLTDVLNDRPRGVIAWGQRVTGNAYYSSGYQRPFLRVDAVLYPGRLYKIWTSNVITCVSANNNMVLTLFHKVNEECTVQNGTQLMATRAYHDFGHSELQVLYTLPSTYTEPTTVSFLLAQYVASGTAYLKGENQRPAQLAVEDMGRNAIPSGVNTLNASTDRAPLTPTQTLSVTSTTTAYYGKPVPGSDVTQIMSVPGQNVGDQYQYGHVGMTGNREYRTLVWFPDVTTTLAGRTILRVRFKAYVVNWNDTNTTSDLLALGIHNYADYTTAPGTTGHMYLPPNFTEVTADTVPAMADKWIELPQSTWNAWQTGQARGICLQRPLTRNDDEYYGRPRGPFTLEFTYN